MCEVKEFWSLATIRKERERIEQGTFSLSYSSSRIFFWVNDRTGSSSCGVAKCSQQPYFPVPSLFLFPLGHGMCLCCRLKSPLSLRYTLFCGPDAMRWPRICTSSFTPRKQDSGTSFCNFITSGRIEVNSFLSYQRNLRNAE